MARNRPIIAGTPIGKWIEERPDWLLRDHFRALNRTAGNDPNALRNVSTYLEILRTLDGGPTSNAPSKRTA